jgi:hypothetical protein
MNRTFHPQDFQLGKDAAVQLREATVYKTGGIEPFCSGILPCLKPGMMLTDCDRNKVGVAKLCTANAVTYETAEGETFTTSYDSVALEVAGPEHPADAAASHANGSTTVRGFFIEPKDDPRGERNHDFETISNMDARFGVRVPIGARVYFGDDQTGRVVGGTEQLAIIRDDQGREQAETWGTVMVQASGPAFGERPTSGAIPAGVTELTPDQVEQLRTDPYRSIALRVADVMAGLDRLASLAGDLTDEHDKSFSQLYSAFQGLNELADQRAERVALGNDRLPGEGQVQA